MAGPEQLPSHPKSPLLFPEGQAAREGIFANAKRVGACLPAACPLPPLPAISSAAFAGCAVLA